MEARRHSLGAAIIEHTLELGRIARGRGLMKEGHRWVDGRVIGESAIVVGRDVRSRGVGEPGIHGV